MSRSATARVAVIGAGMAGATCARLLADAGHSVRLFDKARGVGGRMATRRVAWGADGDAAQASAFDHGAPGFTARSPDFVRFVAQAQADGLLVRWAPVIAPGSYAPLGDTALWVPAPDMPALCRTLVAGLPVNLACPVDALRQAPDGWCVESAGSSVARGFSDVVLALPPQQAAALLQPHRPDWAQRAQAQTMLPGWTLLGVTPDMPGPPAWDLAWPAQGPLSWIVRNDAKPGRTRVPGLAHWVAHASAPWSQMHLDTPAAKVQALLQEALAQSLGRPLTWQHAAVHRWRYASVPRAAVSAAASAPAAALARCWWDSALGLGLCGDALGGAGVEGAWASGRALATALIDCGRTAPSNASAPESSTR